MLNFIKIAWDFTALGTSKIKYNRTIQQHNVRNWIHKVNSEGSVRFHSQRTDEKNGEKSNTTMIKIGCV